MNAQALLKSQGWRGHGNTLHPTSNSIGLSKPLLLSRNTDGRGIGNNTHYTSDQWWLDAFDQKLKGLDTSSKSGAVTQTVTSGKLDVIASGIKQGKYTGAKGLYACFVRGGMLDGSRSPEELIESSGASTPVSEPAAARRKESKEEKRIRKEEKRIRKEKEKQKRKEEKKVSKRAAKLLIKESETKEERRERRKERRKRKEERRERREKKEGKNESG